ncbi:hypothetical protein Ddye_011269 [Dipteronia dyeriana]|uniref:Reverse transcriptase zinc-binding domain-containing protein n=1 Tax=Dipteronia dyeriana TaxID=168575 RepID=A0AAD9X272_9ROSI|nr:hypothetical protein Ddye_011269 [Dipteronia dyeriana]
MNSLSWNWNDNPSTFVFTKYVGSLLMQGSKKAKVLQEGLKVIVGKGDRIRLWKDIKVKGVLMKEAFPRIFALSSNKVDCLEVYGNIVGDVWNWDILLRKPCFGREMNQWEFFRSSLQKITIFKSTSDTIGWMFSPNGKFYVNSFWEKLDDGNSENFKALTWVWQGFNPPNIEIFVWHLLHGRVMVKEVLKKFGVLYEMSEECPLCSAKMETVDHLFLYSELLAIAQACELCVLKFELTGKNIVFSSDSMTAVSWINSPNLGNINHMLMIYDIHNALFKRGQSSVEYNPRATNSYADSLAKEGVGSDETVVISWFL